jgi:hypothetical protein
MNKVGISLGWDCDPAAKAVKAGVRKTKAQGYKTCPFDIGISNYEGLIKCLKEDFKFFCDTNYLKLFHAPCDIPPSLCKNERLIYNTRYNFIFNHESPDHGGCGTGDLWKKEKWPGGSDHYIANNFKEFIIRYSNRINNFREYLNGDNYIIFYITKLDSDVSELKKVIEEKYPNLKFDIHFSLTSCPEGQTPGYHFNENHKLMYRN